jgi:hypothetical protein
MNKRSVSVYSAKTESADKLLSLGNPKRQKVQVDLNADFSEFFAFLFQLVPIDFLLVYQMSSVGFEPVHPYAFLFSRLAQTCHLARKMFRPYSIMLRQVHLKFELQIDYLRSISLVYDFHFEGFPYNWRCLCGHCYDYNDIYCHQRSCFVVLGHQ